MCLSLVTVVFQPLLVPFPSSKSLSGVRSQRKLVLLPAHLEAMVLCMKPMDSLLRVGNASLPQVKEFKYLRFLFSSGGTMEHETGRIKGALGAVLQ